MATSTETILTIQNFHQCSSLATLKLSKSNLLLWKSQIVPLVKSLGVFNHLAGVDIPLQTIKVDEKLEINPAYTVWTNNDGLLTTWLIGTISEEVLLDLEDASSAHNIWQSIENMMLPQSKEKEILLTDSLMSLTKGSMTLEQYLRTFKGLCDNLTAIGKPLDETIKVFNLARGLGPRYKDFRMVMLSKPPYPSYNQFILSLQNHEQAMMLEEASNNPPEQYQAFYSRRGRGHGRGGRFSSSGRGFGPAANQNSFGSSSRQSHFKYSTNDGRFKRKEEEGHGAQTSKKEENYSPLLCQICDKRGHTAIKCWSRFDHSIQPEEQLREALAAMHMHEDIDPTLYADSGATKHVMNNPGKDHS